MIPIRLQTYKYYKRCNNINGLSKDVLLLNEKFDPKNIIVAYLFKYLDHNGESKKSFVFFKFPSIHEFLLIMDKLRLKERRFFSVILHNNRCLYLDIDGKLSFTGNIKQLHNRIVNELIKYLQQKYSWINIHHINYWCASRTNKLSMHIICDRIQFTSTEELKYYVSKFREILNISDVKVDLNIYNKDFQLWRLPFNLNFDEDSELKLESNANHMCREQQIKINMLNPINCSHDIYKHAKSIVLNKKNMIKQCISNKVSNKSNRNWINIMKKNKINITLELQRIFKDSHWNIKEKTTYFVQNAECPFKKKKHKRNRLSVKLYINHNVFKYISVKCLDSDCDEQSYYISLCSEISEPWIFERIKNITNHLTISEIQEIYFFIICLEKNKIIINKKSTNIYRFTNENIKFEEDELKMSIFFSPYIIHSECKQNKLLLHVRKNEHRWYYQYGKITVWCLNCGKYIT